MSGVVDYVRAHFTDHPWTLVPVGIGLTMITLSLTRRWHPPWLGRLTDRLQESAHRLVLKLSRFITRVGLTVVFYTGISVIHAAFRIGKSDPLARRWKPPGSLWIDYDDEREDSEQARHQY